MPQAPDHLRAKFPGSCEEALEVLEKRFSHNRGVIYPLFENVIRDMTERELEAIDYLCLEWDYGYDAKPESFCVNNNAYMHCARGTRGCDADHTTKGRRA